MKTKNIFVVLLMIVSACIVSCTNTSAKDTVSKQVAIQNNEATNTKTTAPILSFEEAEFDFGTVTEGDILKHTFSFTNTGTAPLVIVNAKGSCGCTVSDWPKEPIAPGASEDLVVTFNTNGKPNLQTKQVTLTTNTAEGKQILKIKAMVTPKVKNATSGTPISK
ncbi:DUF1573 domain-containing protein [Aquimarina sp. 2201CG14-23]|uniref:DUF1573 domain-containing protein n=1 Tax=Aquimarina mycalae TaxID=3040073 RepID=UPI00247800AD|nr:DUF1573 domain-containing protein [Aquimarina sp. 2201CG14-23]MDH7448439.1 DUF1573 domain-containing protein [Aquimarina sp. 2201CG14-23]